MLYLLFLRLTSDHNGKRKECQGKNASGKSNVRVARQRLPTPWQRRGHGVVFTMKEMPDENTKGWKSISYNGSASVHHNRLAGDETGEIGTEEENGVHHVGYLGDPACRDGLDHLFVEGLI